MTTVSISMYYCSAPWAAGQALGNFHYHYLCKTCIYCYGRAFLFLSFHFPFLLLLLLFLPFQIEGQRKKQKNIKKDKKRKDNNHKTTTTTTTTTKYEWSRYNQADICSHTQKNQYWKKKKWLSCRWDLVAQYRYFHHGATLVLNLK